MRVVKEAEIRKSEILDTAEKLFASKGFENTSTTDILNDVGIARGTLYYHFKSKEDILSAVIDRQVSYMAAKAKAIAENKEIPALQRIILAVSAIKADGELGKEITEQMHKPQNTLMHQKTQDALFSKINPIISGVLKEAIDAGMCSTDYPDEVIDTIMVYSSYAFDHTPEITSDEHNRKINGFIYNIERLFCVEQGSLRKLILPLFSR